MTLNEQLLTYVVGPILTILGTWLMAKKKMAATLRKADMDYVDGAVKIWKELGEGITEKLKEREFEFEKLKKELEKTNQILIDLKRDYEKLQKDYNDLVKQLKKQSQ